MILDVRLDDVFEAAPPQRMSKYLLERRRKKIHGKLSQEAIHRAVIRLQAGSEIGVAESHCRCQVETPERARAQRQAGVEVYPAGHRRRLKARLRPAHAIHRSIEGKVKGRFTPLLVYPGKRDAGQVANDDGLFIHRRSGEKILIARCIKIDAIGSKVFGREPHLPCFGEDRGVEIVRPRAAKGERVDIANVNYPPETVPKIVRLAGHIKTLSRRAKGTKTAACTVIDSEKISRDAAGGARPGAKARGETGAAQAEILKAGHQIGAGVNRPEKSVS